MAGLATVPVASAATAAKSPHTAPSSIDSSTGKPAADRTDTIRYDKASTDAALAYWTPARMKAAVAQSAGTTQNGGTSTAPRLTTTTTTTTATAATAGSGDLRNAIGPLFYHTPVFDWICTGEVINTQTRNIVVTAGHCILLHYDQSIASWRIPLATVSVPPVFAPGYANGQAPFGKWTISAADYPKQFAGAYDQDWDYGAYTMNANSGGQQVGDVVGMLPWAINAPYDLVSAVIGTPMAQSGNQVGCVDVVGQYTGSGSSLQAEINCPQLTDGASGGPFIAVNSTTVSTLSVAYASTGGYHQGGRSGEPDFGVMWNSDFADLISIVVQRQGVMFDPGTITQIITCPGNPACTSAPPPPVVATSMDWFTIDGSLANAQNASGTISLASSATNADKVLYFLDNTSPTASSTPIASDPGGAEHAITYDTVAQGLSGQHTITAAAIDASGNIADTITISITTSNASLNSFTINGSASALQTIDGTMQLSATETLANGVWYYLDGSSAPLAVADSGGKPANGIPHYLSYDIVDGTATLADGTTYSVPKLWEGRHSITASALDASGQIVSSKTITFTVQIAPKVTIDSGLTNGGVYGSSTVAVTGTALPGADAFYFHFQQNGVDKLVSPAVPGTPGTPSHTWQFDPNLLPDGTYQVFAAATLGGVVGVSPTITITVNKFALTYTGAKTADYHDAFSASATLTDGGKPVTGAPVSFALGSGGPGQTCSATTDANGSANCPLTPDQAPGSTTVTADYTGSGQAQTIQASAPFTITREETSLTYAGPSHLGNGAPATLSADLKEDGTAPVPGRTVAIAIGSGATQQSCTGTTDASGTVSCTIPTLNQPLNDTGTLPLTATFAGDAFYLASTGATTVRLEYFTGRAFGLSAQINLLLLSSGIPPTPDTGEIRTAQASNITTPCSATVDIVVINAAALCAGGSVTLAPGTATMTASLQQTTIGLPGLPVIGLSGVTSTSVSSCTGSHGAATMTLTIAGVPVTVPTAPNSVINLAGGAELIINEQTPTTGADHGLTVNAAHLIAAGGLADVVIASSTSGAHNCS